MHTSRFLRILAALFALSLMAAACGDDDDSGADDLDESTDDGSEDSGGDDSGSDDADADEGDDDSGDESSAGDLGDVFSGNCQEAIAAFGSVQTQFAGAFTGAVTDETLDDAEAALDELADAAPDEVEDAFAVYAEELGAYFEVIADLDLEGLATGQVDPDTIQALTDAAESVDQDALEAAGQQISDYFEGACG